MSSRARKGIASALTAVAAVALCAGTATGERGQSGNVIASLAADLRPHFLPRFRSVPVAVSMSSNFSTSDGGRLPQLRTISIVMGKQGKLHPAGLPICGTRRVQVTTREGALAECAQSLVGHGHMSGEVTMPGQGAFPFDARILAFNGRLEDGRVAVIAHVNSKAPPVSFVMPFIVRSDGQGGSEMFAKLPATAGGWVRTTHFDLTLERQFRYHGEPRSYLRASCSIPRGFTALVSPLAKATYTFAGGRSVSAVAFRGCSVRK